MYSYCLFGFNKEGYLRAVARGHSKASINKIEKDEISKGNTCIIAPDYKWDLVPKKYKENMYWVKSVEPKDKERVFKILAK